LIVRPNGRLALEAAQEQALDIQILEQLAEIKDGQEYMTVALFGGKYKDIAHPGQLPLMEKEIGLQKRENDLIDGRVKVLEANLEQRKTVIRTAVRIATVEGSIFGALATLIIEFFRRH
jgi:hypothetical protein